MDLISKSLQTAFPILNPANISLNLLDSHYFQDLLHVQLDAVAADNPIVHIIILEIKE